MARAPVGVVPESYTEASGLIYLIDRYYDPVTGEFVSVDPDLATTGQPYAYTAGDPLNASDPDGLNWYFQLSASAAIYLGEALNGTYDISSALDKAGIAGPIGAAIAYAFSFLGYNGGGDPLISAGEEAKVLAARSGRHHPSVGIVMVVVITVSFWIFTFPTGQYIATPDTMLE